MKVIVFLAAFVFLNGSVSCETRFNNTVLDSMEGVSEKVKEAIAVRITNFTDAVEHKWDIVHDFMDVDDNETNIAVSEEPEVDSTGCNRKLRKHFEDRCDDSYEKVHEDASMIEDERERIEAICCSLEDYEKCNLRAYDQANCVTDKTAIRENLKAARLFLTVIANITCSEFRGSTLCKRHFKNTVLDYMEGVSEEENEDIAVIMATVTDAVDNRTDIVQDLTDGDDIEADIAQTDEPEVDSTGCNRKLRKRIEDRCDDNYEKFYDEAQIIEDDRERIEAICCSLENYEKCSLRAYDQANCVTDKTAIRENFKAVRLFLAVIENISCSEFRGSTLCKRHFKNTVLDSMEGVSEEGKQEIAVSVTNATDAVEYRTDIVHDLMDGDDNETDIAQTEEPEVDSGCNGKLRNLFEDRCADNYEKVHDEAQMIEDVRERVEAICCAVQDHEKCILRAFDQANCVADETARENLKASRFFLTIINNINCSEFRGQCTYYSAAATRYASYAVLLTVLIQLYV